MVELLHWLTLYAPVLFAIQMWFGPGWCCPPPCDEPLPPCGDCPSCLNGESPVEFVISVSDIVNNPNLSCTGADFLNATWTLERNLDEVLFCSWVRHFTSSELAEIQAYNCNTPTAARWQIDLETATTITIWLFIIHPTVSVFHRWRGTRPGTGTTPRVCINLEDLNCPFIDQFNQNPPSSAASYDASGSTLLLSSSPCE